MANVYLRPFGDRAYRASISDTTTDPTDIFVVEEGEYPVEVWWTRHDMNMCRLWATETCENREDLIKLLDFLGDCGHTIEKMWAYEDNEFTNEELSNLFDVCYDRKMEQLSAAIDDMYADWDTDDGCDGDCNHCTGSCGPDEEDGDGIRVVPDEDDKDFPF
jgi:hypothetical protein